MKKVFDTFFLGKKSFFFFKINFCNLTLVNWRLLNRTLLSNLFWTFSFQWVLMYAFRNGTHFYKKKVKSFIHTISSFVQMIYTEGPLPSKWAHTRCTRYTHNITNHFESYSIQNSNRTRTESKQTKCNCKHINRIHTEFLTVLSNIHTQLLSLKFLNESTL